MRFHPVYINSTPFVGVLGAAVAALCFTVVLALPAAIFGPKPDPSLPPVMSDSGISDTVNRTPKGDRLRVIVRPPDTEPFEVQVPAGVSPKPLDGCESAFGHMDHSPAARLAQNCVT
jgi:hypothetical protein